MPELVVVARLPSEGAALGTVAVLGRTGIASSLEQTGDAEWLVKVRSDEVDRALEALSTTRVGSSGTESAVAARIHSRSRNAGLIGLLWVSLGVGAVMILALGGSVLDGYGLLILLATIVATVVAAQVMRGRQ